MSVNPAWIDPKVHTAKCIENTLKVEAACEAYNQKWPKHCNACHGQGGKYTTYDPSAAGVHLSPGGEPDVDTCTHCVDQGICPRCGHQHEKVWTEDYNKCQVCGWDWCKNPDEMIPDHDICDCRDKE
jgi:hypothetical protein